MQSQSESQNTFLFLVEMDILMLKSTVYRKEKKSEYAPPKKSLEKKSIEKLPLCDVKIYHNATVIKVV